MLGRKKGRKVPSKGENEIKNKKKIKNNKKMIHLLQI
jgi:hypothetical protein